MRCFSDRPSRRDEVFKRKVKTKIRKEKEMASVILSRKRERGDGIC
jgi:hypothetical protein